MKIAEKAVILSIGCVCLISLFGCVSDAVFKFNNTSAPEQLNDGWQVASPEDVNISRQALNQIYDDLISEDQYFNAISLLVVKNGKLVFETYCRNPRDRDRIGHIQSVTKSITSLLFGIAKSEGYIDSLDETLYSIIPDKFSSAGAKQSITLRHLLTMTSGLSFDNGVFSVEIYTDKPHDPIAYILKKPLYATPGDKFYYRDCDPHLVSYVMQRLTGKTEEEWARERLFDPLEIRDYYWDSDHTGITKGAHGLHLKPRDMAKIGQMVLDNGRWNGRQIVDPDWLAASTQKQIVTPYQNDPYVWDYGFYWWIIPNRQSFTTLGHGGNFIFISPDKNMVVVMTSMANVDDDVVGTELDDFEKLIDPLFDED